MFRNYSYSVTKESTDVPPVTYSFKNPDKNKELVDYLKALIHLSFKKGDKVFFIVDNKITEGSVEKADITLQTNGDTLSFTRLYDLNANGAVYRGICQDRLATSVQELYDKQKTKQDTEAKDFFTSLLGGRV